MRKEDKYDSKKAFTLADVKYNANMRQINEFVSDNAAQLLESMYRAGYMQACEDYGIDVYPKNITSRKTVEVEES